MEYFLRTLSFVPEDRLNWSPAPTAKSALEIAAHCAGYSGGFARVISAGAFPSTAEEFRNPIHAVISSIASVKEAESILREGIADTVAALDKVPADKIEASISTPQGSTPFRFFMTIPSAHLTGHAYQIDYLQTCWDDQVVHF
jgi:hypothetical protein